MSSSLRSKTNLNFKEMCTKKKIEREIEMRMSQEMTAEIRNGM